MEAVRSNNLYSLYCTNSYARQHKYHGMHLADWADCNEVIGISSIGIRLHVYDLVNQAHMKSFSIGFQVDFVVWIFLTIYTFVGKTLLYFITLKKNMPLVK